MPSLGRGEVVGCANPVLDLFTSVNGQLVDISSADFEIIAGSPSSPGAMIVARTAISIADCPIGQRLSTGRYTAVWTVPLAQTVGTYHINWYFRQSPTSPEATFTQEFEVLAVTGSGAGGYTTVSALRDEGVTVAMADDSKLLRLISLATERIDRLTGQFFSPRQGTMRVDGRNSKAIRFRVPIISISEVRILDNSDVSYVVEPLTYEIYNRHTTGTFMPDDRNDPRIILNNSGSVFPNPAWPSPVFHDGHQNVEVDGVWGYTDPPYSPGVTPAAIERACQLMVIDDMKPLAQKAARAADRLRYAVKEEDTRDQRVEFDINRVFAGSYGYALTGNPEVDAILVHYMAPVEMGDTGGLDGGLYKYGDSSSTVD